MPNSVRKLAALFPNAMTKNIDPKAGEGVRSIDPDVLWQEISGCEVERREDRYLFTRFLIESTVDVCYNCFCEAT